MSELTRLAGILGKLKEEVKVGLTNPPLRQALLEPSLLEPLLLAWLLS